MGWNISVRVGFCSRWFGFGWVSFWFVFFFFSLPSHPPITSLHFHLLLQQAANSSRAAGACAAESPEMPSPSAALADGGVTPQGQGTSPASPSRPATLQKRVSAFAFFLFFCFGLVLFVLCFCPFFFVFCYAFVFVLFWLGFVFFWHYVLLCSM